MHQEIRPVDPLPQSRLTADAERVFEVVRAGGIAIVPLDVAYAIIAAKADALARIFAAKRRSFDKPSGMLGDLGLSRELHMLPAGRREIARVLVEDYNLPFSIVAEYRADHPLIRAAEPFVLKTSTKAGTLDMLINAGALHDAIVRLSAAQNLPVFGSSANRSLAGSKFRLADIEPTVRAVATLAIDYGTCKYENPEGRSSTIIDFRSFSVVRRGVCFDQIQRVFALDFAIELRTE
jgi:tRNA A37 threonylcarbamoyladenosine synthetase subunit TsaC/SUA5/YrdC